MSFIPHLLWDDSTAILSGVTPDGHLADVSQEMSDVEWKID